MRGIIIGQESVDAAIIRLASAAETTALVREKAQVNVVRTTFSIPDADGPLGNFVGADIYIRTPAGEFQRLGEVRDITQDTDRMDMGGDAFGNQMYRAGLTRVYGTFDVSGAQVAGWGRTTSATRRRSR